MKAQVADLDYALRCATNEKYPSGFDAVIWGMQAKIRRQAAAIRSIQKVGWQPSWIIREEP